MNLYRVLAVSGRVLGEFRNDRRTLALLFVAPVFVMIYLALPSADV